MFVTNSSKAFVSFPPQLRVLVILIQLLLVTPIGKFNEQRFLAPLNRVPVIKLNDFLAFLLVFHTGESDAFGAAVRVAQNSR